jgi:hypothetical protein
VPQRKRPIADRLLDGTYKPSKHGPIPVPVGAENLKKPASLTGRSAAIWKELVALLAGTIRGRHIPALTELCRWIERSERVAKELDAMGVTDKAFRSLLVSAAICTDKIASLTAKFGLNPVDGLKVPQPPKNSGVPTW